MEKYDDLKPETFLFLLEDSYFSNALIVSSLLISFYNEKCMKEINTDNTYKDLSFRKFKPLISPSYLKECSKKLEFSNPKINELDYMQKIKLIRNKLAHGDFVIDETRQNIILTLSLKNEEIETKVSINSISALAKSLSEYSRYPNSNETRETFYYENGLEYKIVDTPRTKFGRNSSYDKKLDIVANTFIHHKSKFPLMLVGRSEFSTKFQYKPFALDICVREVYDKKSNYPNRKSFEYSMLEKLSNPLEKDYLGNEFVEPLIDFYRYYIYPLENFLKIEDKNAMSLVNDEMFNFEDLIIASDKMLKSVENVGKIRDYKNYFPVLENKIKDKYEKLVEKENNPYYTDATNIVNLKTELDNYLSFFTNSSIVKFYPYSKKRSLIEHIRCSIEHGTYNYNNEKSNISFIDNWEDNNFNIDLSVLEFMVLVCNENKKMILEQFKNVYSEEENIILSR